MDQPRNRIPESVEKWCLKHGYTEPFCHEGQWWAFPPHGVNPLPLPLQKRAASERPSLETIQRKLISYFIAAFFCLTLVFLIHKALSTPPEFFIGFAIAFLLILTTRGLVLITEYLLY